MRGLLTGCPTSPAVSAMSDDEFMCVNSSDEEDGGLDSEEELGFSGEEEEVGHVAKASKSANTYQILTMDMISKKMFEIIDEVKAVFHVSLLRPYSSPF